MNKLKFVIITISFYYSSSCFSQTWQTYDSLRNYYTFKKSFDTALVFAEKALLAVKEKTGENDTLYANMLKEIVYANNYCNKYSKAIEYCKKEKEIRKVIVGEKHPTYATCLNNLALSYFYMGNYAEAEPIFIEAKNIQSAVLGNKHKDYAKSLYDLAELYRVIGNFPKAESLLIEAKEICRDAVGEDREVYANVLISLVVIYQSTGNYISAEPLALEAKKVNKEIFGEKHPSYAKSLYTLAELYNKMENYQAAEPLYLLSKNIFKDVLGTKSTLYASSLHGLASFYLKMGNYSAAEPLFIEAMNLRKEILGNKHTSYANTLFNISSLYQSMGNYIAAEPFLMETINIFKESLGEKSPSYLTALFSLATLKTNMNNYSEAISILMEVKNIRKEILGEKHPDYAMTLNSLAIVYRKMGNYPLAHPLYIESNNIYNEIFGNKNITYAKAIINLAVFYKETNEYSRARSLYIEGLEILNNNLVQNFSFLSEKEKESYFKTTSRIFEDFYSFSLLFKAVEPEITKTVFNYVVNNKGFLLKSTTSMRSSILSSKDTATLSQYENWISLKKEISKLYSTQISKRKKNPEELEQLANNIEKELVRGSQIFTDFEKSQNLNWESVRNNLKSNEAAIEFARFTEGKKSDTTTYCALLITPNCKQPEMIRLFDEKQIMAILNHSKGSGFNQINELYSTSTKDSLYKLIWQPLEKYLNGIKKVYYSPDGVLHKVSFSALGKSKNVYLCDEYYLQQVSSTGKVAMPENSLFDKNLTACIIGGVDYAADSSVNSIWQYLPGTLTEANNIKTELSKKGIIVTTFSGKEASELNFKNIYSKDGWNPGILHIATHGFFYPDPEQVSKEIQNKKVEEGLVAFRGGNSGFGLWQFVKNKNPLMRSGVVLSGANKVWSEPYSGTDNEGVLTAQEVTQLDMSKTKLVVLSACETGLGDIKGSEGVYGLQRAFKMAGVKFIVMSLWQVPDKETVEFMEIFYSKLLKQKDIRLAFTDTQKEMRQKYDPYYWAAFVLVE